MSVSLSSFYDWPLRGIATAGPVFILLVVAVVFSFDPSPAAAEKPRAELRRLVLATAGTPGTSSYKYLAALLHEAFARHRIEIRIKPVPAVRATELMRIGAVDGDVVRSRIFNRDGRHPSYVLVDESTYALDWVAWTVKASRRVAAWADLRRASLKVAYRRGMMKAMIELAPLKKGGFLCDVETDEEGFRSLLSGAIDVYVHPNRTTAREVKASIGIPADRFKELGVVERLQLYTFLHRRHARLAPVLAETLREMKREGRLEALKRKFGLK